jgi:transposase
MGRSRGGLTTKIHAVVDADGRPIRLDITAGQAHDGRMAEPMLQDISKGTILLADKAYDTNALRDLAAQKHAWANIPAKSNRKDSFPFSAWVYRQRNLVERFFNSSNSSAALQRATTKTRETFWPPSKSSPRAFRSRHYDSALELIGRTDVHSVVDDVFIVAG